MTWAPNVPTQEEIEGFVEDLMAVTPEILGIDETIPGCEIINMNPYGVPAGTLPRYIRVAVREYYQDVFYRGGISGLAVGDFVSVTHFREGNRYEVTGAGGGGGSMLTLPVPGGQGWAMISDAIPVWVADVTPTWLGTHTWGSGFVLMPTDATGQSLGDATHRWDLHTQAVYFEGASGANEITVPDNIAIALELLDAGGLEYARVVSTNANPYVLIDPAGAGIKVAIGLAAPNQVLTVEGTIDLKEQAAASPDTVAYGQIWVKNAAPNELWFTDDTGVDVQLGVGGGALPPVAGAGYALISTGVNTWAADLTPLWLGTHTWGSGFSILPTDASGQDLGAAGARWDLYTQDIIFGGATGANAITVPDNIADALHVSDAGGLEYMRVVSTNANPYFLIDPAGAGIDVGIATASPEGRLDVAYGSTLGRMTLLLGANLNATTRTNNTNKYTLIGSYHYTNAEEPVGIIRAYSSNVVNRVEIGGGSLYCNAATEVSIYTAANRTTPSGTNRFSISSTGAITVTGPSMTVPAAWNSIVPDNVADAFGLDDVGGIEYLKIITTDAQPVIRFNDGGVDVDFEVEAVGVADALQIQGSDGQITLGALTAGFIKSSAGGVLSSAAEVALAELAGYAQGSIIRGGAADWEVHSAKTNHFILVGDGIDIVSKAFDWDDMAAGAGADMVHTHGSAAEGGVALGPLDSITMADDAWIGIGAALERIVFDAAGDISVMGANFGVGVLVPTATSHLESGDGVVLKITRLGVNKVLIGDLGAANDGGILLYDFAGAIQTALRGSTTDDSYVCLGGGDFGVGVAPTLKLTVKDDAANSFVAKFFNDGDNVNRWGIQVTAGADNGAAVGTTYYFMAYDGNGDATGTLKTVNGTFTVSDISDEQRKTNIVDTKTVGLDIINGLRVRDYNWKANPDGPVMTSFVAQEAQKVYPDMVGESPGGTLMTSRAMLIPILTKAIQELDARLAKLEVT